MTKKKTPKKKATMKRALFVRVGEDVLEALRTLTKRYRARHPGQRWSTADVVRVILLAAVREETSRPEEPKPPVKKARSRAKPVASSAPREPPADDRELRSAPDLSEWDA
jgi:uncharacterized protein (DUF4415 family)